MHRFQGSVQLPIKFVCQVMAIAAKFISTRLLKVYLPVKTCACFGCSLWIEKTCRSSIRRLSVRQTKRHQNNPYLLQRHRISTEHRPGRCAGRNRPTGLRRRRPYHQSTRGPRVAAPSTQFVSVDGVVGLRPALHKRRRLRQAKTRYCRGTSDDA